MPLFPWMLLGGAAVGIPITLHFFFKARYKPLPWAAMRFLKEAIEQTSRRLKFQEWVLLALRCLVLLLLAYAISRPAPRMGVSAGRGTAVDAVLVLDTSYSMGAKDGDKTRFERAKEAALDVLEKLPPNSSVQIYTCADRAAFVGPKTRQNLDQAKQLIPTLELTGLSTDFLPGLTEALAAANTGSAPAKEIYVFTDLQKSGFEKQQGAVRAKCDEIRAAGSLVFIRCGNPDRPVPNVAITGIELFADMPHTGTAVPVKVTVLNTGSVAVKAVKVRLWLDGAGSRADEQVADIEPGQSVPVTLTAELGTAPGRRVFHAELEGDGLPGDNDYYKIVLVRDSVQVLLVDGTPDPENGARSAAHYVRAALVPVPAEKIDSYFIKTEVVPVPDATPASLGGKQVCQLLNVPVTPADGSGYGLTPQFVTKLGEFVREGGGLVIGCGDNVKPEDYNRVLGSGGAGLLPFDLGAVESTGEAYPFTLAPETLEHPSFLSPAGMSSTVFRDTAFRDIGMTRMVRLNESGPGAAGGRVLFRTTDGKAFVASRIVGDGEVIFVSTSLDDRWGNFPAKDIAFLPFMRFALSHLSDRKSSGIALSCGDPLVWYPPDVSRLVEVVQPVRAGQSETRRVKMELPVAAAPGDRPAITYSDTVRPGEYRLVSEGDPDTKGMVFTVNPDLRESANLELASKAELERLLGFQPTVIPAGAGLDSAVEEYRHQSEWTEWVLLALLLFLVFESVWAWFCGRAW